ncbi:hypothetical protein EC988_009139, partial [Linderina pennispora]
MPNFPRRRSTVGGGADARSGEHDIELGSSVQSDASHLAPTDFTRRGIGTRSIYGVPMAANRPNVDPASTQYSQTSGSIRDRTMLLSNLELHPNLRESIPGRRGGSITFGDAMGGISRRSSTDDRASIEQILAEARPGTGNLAQMLRERSPPALLPANAMRMEEDGRLPPIDPNYWGDAAERVPKNAKMPQRASVGIVPPPSARYGSVGTQSRHEAT